MMRDVPGKVSKLCISRLEPQILVRKTRRLRSWIRFPACSPLRRPPSLSNFNLSKRDGDCHERFAQNKSGRKPLAASLVQTALCGMCVRDRAESEKTRTLRSLFRWRYWPPIASGRCRSMSGQSAYLSQPPSRFCRRAKRSFSTLPLPCHPACPSPRSCGHRCA